MIKGVARGRHGCMSPVIIGKCFPTHVFIVLILVLVCFVFFIVYIHICFRLLGTNSPDPTGLCPWNVLGGLPSQTLFAPSANSCLRI